MDAQRALYGPSTNAPQITIQPEISRIEIRMRDLDARFERLWQKGLRRLDIVDIAIG